MNNSNLNTNNLEPKIYVACLASYNNGILHGAWINANQSKDAMQDELNQMLAESPIPGAEEWEVHGYEEFGSIKLEQYSSLKTVQEMAAIIEEYGELGAEVIAYHANDIDYAKTALNECYCGEYESDTDYAEQLMNDCYDVPDYLQRYIDYEKFAQDLFIGDNYSISFGGKFHVFHNE